MPVPGLFSAFYWPGDGIVNTVTPTQAPEYIFPWRHDASTLGMGPVWPKWKPSRKLSKQLTRAWVWIIRHLPPRAVAAGFLVRALLSPKFAAALQVVQAVAQDPTTRHIEKWGEVGRRVISNPVQGENVFRCFAARVKLGETSPEAALLIELAWQAYKAQH